MGRHSKGGGQAVETILAIALALAMLAAAIWLFG